MNNMFGIELSPFQGFYYLWVYYIGLRPMLVLMPFQGKNLYYVSFHANTVEIF